MCSGLSRGFDSNLTVNAITLSPIRYLIHTKPLTTKQTFLVSLQVFDLVLKNFNTLFIPSYVRSIRPSEKGADCSRVHLEKPLNRDHAVDFRA
jgi:hypothetical protein